MKGLVIKTTGTLCKVLSDENLIFDCKIKGKTRLQKIDFTNPIAVGDYVDFQFNKKNNIGFIEHIHKRKNYIIRKSVNLSHRSQLIASNIDLALLIITIDNPVTSLNFIDRFLVQSAAYGIESKLVFNKIDLINKSTNNKLEFYQKIYKEIGYEVISSSVPQKKNIKKIKNLLKNKVTVLTGHSGVGKSSLVNLIEPKLDLKTKTISNYHKQGVHTTTYAEMYPLSFGGFIIDTPGIKGLGLIDIDMNQLSKYFPEMLLHSQHCKFKNCIHVNEPYCGVLNALNKKEIVQSRYDSYLSMLDKNTNYRKNNYK
ncbi:MAG: ribosome small subunit-dependent GTPase A [Flavobacteriales bacterium TMED191]|nr:MAG: ribosome small subunit-dependent GTPase A [Flavobacteriales bacterium TMED191]|tara:strand:- start:1813 stop:2748 length:936 start_codon:yes stop_codon:yes gene_type:complete